MKLYFKKTIMLLLITIIISPLKKTLTGKRKIALKRKTNLQKRQTQSSKLSESNTIPKMKITSSEVQLDTSKLLNDIIIDAIKSFVYLPFTHTLLEEVLQSLREDKDIDKNVPLEIQKLIINLKKYCHNYITNIKKNNINSHFIISEENFKIIKEKYPHSFNKNFLSKKTPFALATSSANIKVLGTIIHQESTHPAIYKPIKSLITNKQLLPTNNNKNLFAIIPNIPKTFMQNNQKTNVINNIDKNDINQYGKKIFDLYTDENMSIINNFIEGYILIQIMPFFNKTVTKKILEFVTQHNKTKTKEQIQNTYKKIISSYRKNILILDQLIEYAKKIEDGNEHLGSIQDIIHTSMKIIFNNNIKTKNQENRKNLKIAGIALSAAALIGGTVFYVNPTMAINGIKTIGNMTKNLFQSSILSPIKTLFSSNSDSITKKITQVTTFQPFHWAADSMIGFFGNTHNKLFNTIHSGEQTFFKTLASNLAMSYVTKKLINTSLKKTGITNKKSNINILSAIKKKIMQATIGQKIYYSFEVPPLFSTVLESSIELYKFEKLILDMPISIETLTEYAVKNDETALTIGKLYNTFEKLAIEHLTS